MIQEYLAQSSIGRAFAGWHFSRRIGFGIWAALGLGLVATFFPAVDHASSGFADAAEFRGKIYEKASRKQEKDPSVPVLPMVIELRKVDVEARTATAYVFVPVLGIGSNMDYVGRNGKSIFEDEEGGVSPGYGNSSIRLSGILSGDAALIPLSVLSNESRGQITIPLTQVRHYPLDRYFTTDGYDIKLTNGVRARWGVDQKPTSRIELTIGWYSADPNFRLEVIDQSLVSEDAFIMHTATVALMRPGALGLRVLLLSLLPGLLIIGFAAKGNDVDPTSPLELGAGFIAVLSLHELLVPSDVRELTYVDAVLVAEVFIMVGLSVWSRTALLSTPISADTTPIRTQIDESPSGVTAPQADPVPSRQSTFVAQFLRLGARLGRRWARAAIKHLRQLGSGR